MGKIRISHYSIHLSRYGLTADRPFSAAVLADLHNRVYHSDIDSLMDAIRHAGCDLVLSAGDLVVMKAGRFSTDQALDLIGRLTAEYPVYTANGNHETRMLRLHPDEYERYTAKLQELGAVNLVNEARSIQICGTLLHIAGSSWSACTSNIPVELSWTMRSLRRRSGRDGRMRSIFFWLIIPGISARMPSGARTLLFPGICTAASCGFLLQEA